MYNFCAKFRQILDICKCHSENLVNSLGNVPRVGVVPRFSDLEVIALSLTAEALGIDSENYLFHQLSKFKGEMPNLISRRQYNDRRKLTAGLCEEIRKRIVDRIDGGEDCFIVDSKPIEVCKPARSKRCAMGRGDTGHAPSYSYCASQRKHYYGYKLHGLAGTSGVFHSYDITAANVHDICYLNDVKLDYHNASRPTSPSSATSSSSSATTPKTSTGYLRESSVKSAHLPSCNTSIKSTTNLLAKLNMRYFNSANG